MPANLTPQYREAEVRYRRAKSLPDRIAALQEMMAVVPKHKGTDHLRADLRARMSRHLGELEKPRSASGGGPQPFNIRKEGAGQALVIGMPNPGKSELANTLTGAPMRIGDYPFTTHVPAVGMLPFENIQIQIVDTPALNHKDVQTELFGLLRNADLMLVVVDLSADPNQELELITTTLRSWGYSLLQNDEVKTVGGTHIQKPAIVVANKADLDEGSRNFSRLYKAYGHRFTVIKISCLNGTGLDILGKATYEALGKVRVYAKRPSGEADFTAPIIMTRGSTVADAAERLHKYWRHKLKYALLWGSSKFDGQRVGRDYLLGDGDVVEFHG